MHSTLESELCGSAGTAINVLQIQQKEASTVCKPIETRLCDRSYARQRASVALSVVRNPDDWCIPLEHLRADADH